MKDPNRFPVWAKGAKSGEARKPLRHPRDKALLLLEQATEEEKSAALRALIEQDPVRVLGALCDAIEVAEAMEDVRRRKEVAADAEVQVPGERGPDRAGIRPRSEASPPAHRDLGSGGGNDGGP